MPQRNLFWVWNILLTLRALRGQVAQAVVCSPGGRTHRLAEPRLTLPFPADRAVRLSLPGQCQRLLPHRAQRLPLQRCPPWRVSGHTRPFLLPSEWKQGPVSGRCSVARPHARRGSLEPPALPL